MLPCAMMSINWEDVSKIVKCVCVCRVDLKGELSAGVSVSAGR